MQKGSVLILKKVMSLGTIISRKDAQGILMLSTLSSEDSYKFYSIKDGKFLATLTQQQERSICGITVYTTDHPKLLVQELRGGNTYSCTSMLSLLT